MQPLARRLIAPLGLLLGLALPAAAANHTPITILHVNDTHSHVDSIGPRDANLEGTIGGLVRAAMLVGTLKATEPNPLFLHAGDAFHGDFFFNAYFDVPELLILKQLGLDAMAVGNHEFDLTPLVLVGALTGVGDFPMTSANLDFTKCPTPTPEQPCALLPNWVKPGILKDVDGVKVGIFGMTIPTDPTMRPSPVVVRSDVVPLAQAAVESLKSQGAQVVILLSHLGLAIDRPVVAQVPGIDVVVEGHDHALYDKPLWLDGPNGAKVPAVSAGDNYLHVGRLKLVYYEGSGVKVESWDVLPVDETIPPAPDLQPLVEQAKAGIVAKYGDVYHTVVGHAPWYLSKRYNPASPVRDTPMGNLITDALRHRTDTEIALTVTGLISEGIYEGPIVGDDVFRPVSYGYDPPTGLGFKIATFQITGAELLKGMEMCLANVTTQDTYDLQFSGLRYSYDSSRPILQRVVPGSVFVHGRRLDPSRKYTVTVNEGIAMLLPSLGVVVTDLNVLPDFEYHALRDYIARLGWLPYTPQARILDQAAWRWH